MLSETFPKCHDFANCISNLIIHIKKTYFLLSHPLIERDNLMQLLWSIHPNVHLSFAYLNLAQVLWGVFVFPLTYKATALTDCPMVQSKCVQEQMFFFFLSVSHFFGECPPHNLSGAWQAAFYLKLKPPLSEKQLLVRVSF